MNTGVFITFDGVDGTGKTSTIEAVAEKLREQGVRVAIVKSPSRPGANEERKLVDNADSPDFSPRARYEFYINETEYDARMIKELREEVDVVLCDRHVYSTIAYHANLDEELYQDMRSVSLETTPDMAVLLTASPKARRERLQARQEDIQSYDKALERKHTFQDNVEITLKSIWADNGNSMLLKPHTETPYPLPRNIAADVEFKSYSSSDLKLDEITNNLCADILDLKRLQNSKQRPPKTPTQDQPTR